MDRGRTALWSEKGKDSKKLTRINMLNLGRKLLGDFTTISDTLRESAAL